MLIYSTLPPPTTTTTTTTATTTTTNNNNNVQTINQFYWVSMINFSVLVLAHRKFEQVLKQGAHSH